MYNQTYEEYIRSILGYTDNYGDNNQCNYSYNSQPYNQFGFEHVNAGMSNNYSDYVSQYNVSSELEDCYPEIYKIIYPMVKKVCNNTIGTVNSEMLENMTDEIFSAIEEDSEGIETNVRIQINSNTTGTNYGTNSVEMNRKVGNLENLNLQNVSEENKVREVRSDNSRERNLKNTGCRNQRTDTKITAKRIDEKQLKDVSEKRETRQRNFAIRDLIKILILRELLGNPHRPHRPNRPPMRPPMRPPRPGFDRPPFQGNPRPPMEPRIYEEIYEY